MKLLRTLVLAVIILGGVLASASPVSADPPLIVVLPSGCIRISPYMQQIDPYRPWSHYDTIYSYDNVIYGRMNRVAYKIRYPTNEFVGAVYWPGGSYYYNAPTGYNQMPRAINCMLSDGGSQG